MRWFIRQQVQPGVYFVLFGPSNGNVRALCETAASSEFAKWAAEVKRTWPAYVTKPLITTRAPRMTGWRRAKSRHIGGGYRVFSERGTPVRNDKVWP